MDLILKKNTCIQQYGCTFVLLCSWSHFTNSHLLKNLLYPRHQSFSKMNFQEELGNGEGLPLIFYPRHQASSNMILQEENCELGNGLCEGFPVVKTSCFSENSFVLSFLWNHCKTRSFTFPKKFEWKEQQLLCVGVDPHGRLHQLR